MSSKVLRKMRSSKNSKHVMYTPKKNVKNVLQDSIAAVDAAQTLITLMVRSMELMRSDVN